MRMISLTLFLSLPAWADEPVTGGPPAEAAEAAEEAPAVQKLPPAPSSLGQLTPERLMALRTYKAQRLQIRAETEYRGSTVSTYGSMSYGYPGAMGAGVVVSDQLSTFRTWGAYRGPQRLSTPDFLNLTGAHEKKDALVNEIQTLRRQAKGWYVVAGVGVAGVVTGLVGMATADDLKTYSTFNLVSLSGTVVTIGGLFGASFPGSNAQRLYKYPGASMSSDQANDLAHAANEELRQKLEIQPNEAWLLDLGAEQ